MTPTDPAGSLPPHYVHTQQGHSVEVNLLGTKDSANVDQLPSIIERSLPAEPVTEQRALNSASPNLSLTDFTADSKKQLEILDAELFKDRITYASEIREIEPVVEIGGSIFASKGDLSVIGGLPKAGKTSVCAYIIATALMRDCANRDTLSIRATYCENKPVYYIDTEQPQAYTNKLRKQVTKILGVDREPDNLFIINLRKYSSEQKREKVKRFMERHPDTHLWIIDGVADLIKDPNDTKEAFGIVEELMIRSDKMNSAVIVHIHENPGTTGKLRGNLGSEAERKCGGAIAIKKDKERSIHFIEAKLIRGSQCFEPIPFRYDQGRQLMVSLSPTEAADFRKTVNKVEAKKLKRIALAKSCLITGSLRHKDLVEAIIRNAFTVEGKSIERRTAENRVAELSQLEIVVQNGEFYELASIYIPQP